MPVESAPSVEPARDAVDSENPLRVVDLRLVPQRFLSRSTGHAGEQPRCRLFSRRDQCRLIGGGSPTVILQNANSMTWVKPELTRVSLGRWGVRKRGKTGMLRDRLMDCNSSTASEAGPQHRAPDESLAGNYFVAAYPPFSAWNAAQRPALVRALQDAAPPEAPLGLYVRLPFCQKKCDF